VRHQLIEEEKRMAVEAMKTELELLYLETWHYGILWEFVEVKVSSVIEHWFQQKELVSCC
jgi:hypothetical protein